MMGRHNSGFTLIELMVTVAVFAILAGMAIPAFSGYLEQRRIDSAAKQLTIAINNMLYQQQPTMLGTVVSSGSDWNAINNDKANVAVSLSGLSGSDNARLADARASLFVAQIANGNFLLQSTYALPDGIQMNANQPVRLLRKNVSARANILNATNTSAVVPLNGALVFTVCIPDSNAKRVLVTLTPNNGVQGQPRRGEAGC